MSHLDILLPFGLPQPELAPDLIRQLKTPALSALLGRAKKEPQAPSWHSFDGFASALPHEAWLAQQFGLADRLAQGGSPPVALAAMEMFDLKPDAGVWFLLQPIHIHVARDHLVLMDQRQLPISEQESRTLFALAEPLCAEAGMALRYGDAHTWFLRTDAWADLRSSTPDAACGHNIDIWMPKGPFERDWRKLQNEVQMHWHDHAINQEREMHGQKPVNSLWLWGGTPTTMPAAQTRYTTAFNLPRWMGALGQSRGLTAAQLIAAAPEQGLLVLDALLEAALAGDWGRWLEQMQELESNWFAPLLAALKAGEIGSIALILSHNKELRSCRTSRMALRQFWRQPSLNRLL
ncbi:hypothetical protein [Herminiimonas sp. CN]|uniref:hypothetical protein n=1 Tax=Herminiimonas sp. CN TaxID=1349818 RepID=UPI0004736D77|nr:hypothetical protein [Herminiimonas sp. CN]